MADPTITVELGLVNADPLDIDISSYDSGDWVDATGDLIFMQFGYGRRSPAEQWGPTSARFVLRDDDRDYDPLNTSGSNYPYVVAGRLVHVNVDHGASGDFDWYGVIKAWRPSYWLEGADEELGTVTVECVDILGLLVQTLSRSANDVAMELLVENKLGVFYDFAAAHIDTSTGRVADQSRNRMRGRGYIDVASVSTRGFNAGSDGLSIDMAEGGLEKVVVPITRPMIRHSGFGCVVEFAPTGGTMVGGQQTELHPLASHTIPTAGATREGWDLYLHEDREDDPPTGTYADRQTNAVTLRFDYIVNGTTTTRTLDAGTRADWIDAAGTGGAAVGRRVAILAVDPQTVTVAWAVPPGETQVNSLDSASSTWNWEQAEITETVNTLDYNYATLFGRSGYAWGGTGYDSSMQGAVYRAAMFEGAASEAWADRLAASVIDRGFEPPDSDTRLERIFDAITMPANSYDNRLTTLDTAYGTLLGAGSTALDEIQQLVAINQGRLYQRSNGLIWVARYAVGKSQSASLRATYSDQAADVGPPVLHQSGTQIVMGGDVVINDVEVTTPTGYVATSSSTTSIAANGRQTRKWSLPFATDADADTFADSVVERYKAARVRAAAIQVRPDDDWWSDLVDREIGHRVVVKRQPGGTGDIVSVPSVIEGIYYTYDATEAHWEIEMFFGAWATWDFTYP